MYEAVCAFLERLDMISVRYALILSSTLDQHAIVVLMRPTLQSNATLA